jgi:hypothetical protein
MKFVKLYSDSIKSGTLQDNTWPEDIRWVRDEIRNRGNAVRRALPFFVLVRGRDVIAAGGGNRSWREIIVPSFQKII